MARRFLIILVGLAALGACDDDTVVSPTPNGQPRDVAAIAAAISAPSAVDMRPCPDGWEADPRDEGVTLCDPYPDGMRECGPGEAHFPGRPGCEPVGVDCPDDGPFSPVPEDITLHDVYVLEGATDGDGTSGRPFGSLADAVEAFPGPGTRFVLGPGDYGAGASGQGRVRVGENVVMSGSCGERTRVRFAVENEPSIRLENLTFQADLLARARWDLRGVVLEVEGGLESRTWVDGQRVLIDGGDVIGSFKIANASWRLRTAVLRRASLDVQGPYGAVAIRDAVMLDPVVPTDLGYSIRSLDGTVDLDAVYIDGPATGGVVSFAGFLSARHVRVADIASDGYGRAIEALEGAIVDLAQVASLSGGDSGIVLTGVDADVADVFVTGTHGINDRAFGSAGFVVQGPSRVAVNGLHVSSVRETGVGFIAADEVVAENIVVRDVLGRRGGGALGRGMVLQAGTYDVSAVHVERAREFGVFSGTDAGIAMRDISIVEILPEDAGGARGHGIHVQGSVLELMRAQTERTRGFGLIALADATVVARELAIHSVEPWTCTDGACRDTPFGHGTGVYRGATLQLSSFAIGAASVCGLHLAQAGAADLAEGLVTDADIGACVDDAGVDLGTRILYRNTRTTFEVVTLPVPDPSDELAGSDTSAPAPT
jgi:hypothetical protein